VGRRAGRAPDARRAGALPAVERRARRVQLHPGAWHFAAGHVPELQLLARDTPYSRASNGVFAVSVSNLEVRLPVHEAPGGQVLAPAAEVLPAGAVRAG
jgi:hypothetical protein